MDVKKSPSCQVHLAMALPLALLACEQVDNPGKQYPPEVVENSGSVEMSPSPPMPIDQIELLISRQCPVPLGNWKRVYSFRWSAQKREFSRDELSFILTKGSYPDLRPSRKWSDIRDAAVIDDRPGIDVIFGHLNLKTNEVVLDVGKC